MGYSSSTGVITAPVGIQDVQQALGDGRTDLGLLCQSSNINMWAKYKPVVKNMIDTTPQLNSDSGKTWKNINGTGGLGTDAWFKGTAGNFGITPKVIHHNGGAGDDRMLDVLEDIAVFATGNLNGWVYTKPSGGAASPYRLIDFNRYNAKAVPPIKVVTGKSEITEASGASWEYSFQIMGSAASEVVTDVDTRDYLLASDVIGTCYLGVAIYMKVQRSLDEVYEPIAWATGNAWLGQGIATSGDGGHGTPSSTYVQATFAKDKTYYALPLFFSEQLPQEQTVSGQIKPYPGYSKQPSTNFKVWTIPYTTFLPFTMHIAATSQRYGYPVITNHAMAMLGWTGSIYLDRTTNSSYYNATGTVLVEYALVNELWNNSNDHNTWPSGSYSGYNSVTKTISYGDGDVTIATNKTLSTSGGSAGEHVWSLIVIVAGEITPFELRQYLPPSALPASI